MELTIDDKVKLINLVSIGNIQGIVEYMNKFGETEQYKISQLESTMNTYQKHQFFKQVDELEDWWNIDDVISDNYYDSIKAQLLLYYKPEVILLSSDSKETHLITKIIYQRDSTTLKLLFDKAIEFNYDISEFKFVSNGKNLFIDLFALEEGNFDTFKKVMIYIKQTYPKYNYKALINILNNPKGHISKYSWFRTLADKSTVIEWTLELFSS